MKVLALLMVILLAGCETRGQKMDDLRAEEDTRAAERTLSLGAMAHNLDLCYQHLKVTELTADKSPMWRAFKKAHGITSEPSGMSDDDLKACNAL
jgi:hypothetical protein